MKIFQMIGLDVTLSTISQSRARNSLTAMVGVLSLWGGVVTLLLTIPHSKSTLAIMAIKDVNNYYICNE